MVTLQFEFCSEKLKKAEVEVVIPQDEVEVVNYD